MNRGHSEGLMSELELVKLHEDGEHLVLSGPGSQTFLLPITEALRAAVRRDRARMEHWRVADSTWLSPRAIQSRLRSGESPEYVAESADVPLEHVRRFAGPVLAEQEYVIERLRAVPADTEGADALGERVDERLELRAVAESDRSWRARREPGEPWTVEVVFKVDGAECHATWSFDQTDKEHHALDDEARWLGQEADDTEVWRTATSAYRATRPVLAAVDSAAPESAPDKDPTHSLLDDLSQRRGVRSDDDEETDSAPETPPLPPARVLSLARELPQPTNGDDSQDSGSPDTASGAPDASDDVHVPEQSNDSSKLDPGAHGRASDTPTSDVTPQADGPTSPQNDPGASSAEQRPDRPKPSKDRGGRRRKARATVPSWDDIVFGAKHD